MATKKTTRTTNRKETTKKVARKESVAAALNTPSLKSKTPKINQRFILNLLLVLLVGTLVFLLAKRYRGLVLAGIVNKSPISRFELNQVLAKRYGKAILDELINERLLLQAAKENKVEISEKDIDAEITKLEETLGGKENLNTAMEQYGLSADDLRTQIRLRLLQTRLADKVVTVEVSEEEIKKSFDDNKALYEGKKFDDVKEQIRAELLTQKSQQEFGRWFQEYKAKAQIGIYLTQ